jgi:hypothetical protein
VTTAAATKPRTLVGGDLAGDWYVLILDGGEVVHTLDESIAKAAASAKRANHAFTIETERQGDKVVVTELNVVIDQPAAKPTPASTAVAKATPAVVTGLTKRPELPTGLISDPQALTNQLTALQAHYHVMSPAISVSQMAPGFGANLAVVQIDPAVVMDKYGNGAGADCYYSNSLLKDQNKRALNKQGLLKIAQAAGIQWVPEHCRRMDDGKERYLWRWQYFGYVRTHDGQLQPVQGSRELDLRDGSAEATAMKDQQLDKARAVGNQVCETKAMQRAIRTLGIRQAYTLDELKKPFLIVRFSFTPDMSDPEIKKAVTLQAMGGLGALYQAPAANVLPALPETTGPVDETERPVETAPVAAAKKSNPFADDAATTSNTTETIPDGSTTILEVKPNKSQDPKNPWVRYDVTFGTGQIASTFSQTMHKLIDDAVAQKARVRVETVENEGYNDKITKLEIVDKRQQSLPNPGDL